ncbi:hypothetical protein SAMN04488007_0689 [Maribacter aquivivus]|uniref:DUF7677 domain-containing protein n=1 Tax=Maribacter aquivivus TaxID=228958 RepID=A0A1M6K858_9FLAO|nr:hypothetical protein [Maribacter aquivivus]SHJ55114.1 hypothetical protein SAMN04488007_0689 [Maribacter aquivivus]
MLVLSILTFNESEYTKVSINPLNARELFLYFSKVLFKGMKLSNSFKGSLRTFTYFMASGTHSMLKGINYVELYGNEPSAIERVFAIYTNVIELDGNGIVINDEYAQKRATDYLHSYYDSTFIVQPQFEDWEIELH